MKRYTLHVRQAALDEAEEIRAWYEEQSGGLGGPIPVRVGCLLRGPDQESAPANAQGAFPVVSINGFPLYRVVFVVDGEAITAYQIRHTSRIPHRTSGP